MSEHGAVVERYVGAFNRGDLDTLVETLHPDIEIHSRRGIRTGIEAAREWATRAPGGLQQQLAIDEFHEHGDDVVTAARRQWFWDGTDDLASEDPLAIMFGFRDGKIVRWQSFENLEQALVAAGAPLE